MLENGRQMSSFRIFGNGSVSSSAGVPIWCNVAAAFCFFAFCGFAIYGGALPPQGVSLIAKSLAGGQALRGKKRHPTVEDNVTIYAGTTVMGGDTMIGAGSTIGANVFLTESVPARSLVRADSITLDGAGHALQVEQAEAFTQRLLAFFSA